jgi:hypothetical protein
MNKPSKPDAIRIKIRIADSVLPEHMHTKFWYWLQFAHITRIEELKQDLLLRLFNVNRLNLQTVNMKMTVEGCELPMFETARVLRDSDVVV